MKLIDDIRRDNIDRLQKELGSIKALAEKLGRDESQVSQWKLGSKNSSTGKPRGMRAETARYIEGRCSKPVGWLDQDHEENPSGLVIPLPDGLAAPLRSWEHESFLPPGQTVFIPRLTVGQDLKLAGGQVTIGFVTSESQAFDTVFINSDQLKPSRLGYVEVTDDSMHPTLERGDRVVVDTSQTQIVDGRTFAIFYDGMARLRRLFRVPGGGLRIEADNQRHSAFTLDPAGLAGITILGLCVQRTGRGGL